MSCWHLIWFHVSLVSYWIDYCLSRMLVNFLLQLINLVRFVWCNHQWLAIRSLWCCYFQSLQHNSGLSNYCMYKNIFWSVQCNLCLYIYTWQQSNSHVPSLSKHFSWLLWHHKLQEQGFCLMLHIASAIPITMFQP